MTSVGDERGMTSVGDECRQPCGLSMLLVTKQQAETCLTGQPGIAQLLPGAGNAGHVGDACLQQVGPQLLGPVHQAGRHDHDAGTCSTANMFSR